MFSRVAVKCTVILITVNNVCSGRFLTDRLREGRSFQEKIAQGMSEADTLYAKNAPDAS